MKSIGLKDEAKEEDDEADLSDNLQAFKSNCKYHYLVNNQIFLVVSDNLAGADPNDGYSPRFNPDQVVEKRNRTERGDEDDHENGSISLTQYYLKGSVKEKKNEPGNYLSAAKNEQKEFL